MTILFIAGGLVALVLGGELLIRGAVTVAHRLGVSQLLIGIVLLGFGTSLPEMVTSLQAAFAGAPGLAVGNVVGSNIANTLLILGVAAAIRPVAMDPRAFRRDGGVMVLATLATLAVVLIGTMGRIGGAVFVLALVTYMVTTYLLERNTESPSAEMHKAEAEDLPSGPRGLPAALLLVVVGLVVTVLGARFLVEGAVDLARGFGVSEAVIGLTLVAIGTSLPELTTSAVAALRGHSDVAIGNVIGSNIYNLLGILGVTALAYPLRIPPEIAAFDIWVMLAATVLLVVVAVSGWRITRREGGLLLSLYAGYIGYLALVRI